jgi:isopenicillin-N N-acyltransferase-like protein
VASLRVLDLPSDPTAAGWEHGRRVRDLIAHNLAVYFDRFAREAQLTPAQVRERARRYLPVIDGADPGYGRALRALAEGSGLPLEDLVALNARYELLYSQYSLLNRARPRLPSGCTALAVTPDASADGHLWLGQNWDWFPDVRGLLVRSAGRGGLRVAAFTEAGIVGGKIGLNSAGLGLAVNGLLSTQDDWARLRPPFHVRTWQILHAMCLEDAVGVIVRDERACSANFLVGHGGPGRVVDVEAAPRATCTLVPSEGVLVHANHFEDPRTLGVEQPLAADRASTYHRAARAWRLLGEMRRAGGLDAGGLVQVLADHDGHPESICRHPNPALPEEERVQTVVSVLMDLTARRLYVAAGPPCAAAYRQIPLT